MKTRWMLLAGIMCTTAAFAQEDVRVDHFDKIVASPRVNVILQSGDKESLSILYNRIPKNKVNVVVRGKTLRIYLDHAKMVEKQKKVYRDGNKTNVGIYDGATITAYITYRELKGIEMRGEEELRCDSPLKSEKLKLKAYGENELNLADVQVKRFKVVLYGQNDLKLHTGKIEKQKYKLFGTNHIDASGVEAQTVASKIYGEGHLKVKAMNTFNLTAIGEPTVQLLGTAHVHKGIWLGRVRIEN